MTGLVAGRFRLGGLLGSGGTASVFSARDERTGRTVAVKLLHPHLSRSETVRDAFLLEARRAARIRHPGIVSVIDLGVFDDHGSTIAWIAQALLPGATLAEHVRDGGALAVPDAVSLAGEVLDALGAAHAAGLVHRDVSPANVMVHVDGDGRPRATLLDFGLADAAGETARGDDVLRSTGDAAASGVVGNAEYASPEQLSGHPVGPAGDLYQVGGLLYFALTGRPPFSGADRSALVRAHLTAPPPVPSVVARGIPSELDRVVVRAMLKDPDDRFADAARMRDAILAAVAVRRPSVAPTPGDAPASTPGAASAPAADAVLARTLVSPMPELREASTAAVTAASATAAAEVDRSAEPARSAPGWGMVVSVIALLAAVATIVPLIAGAGRSAPTTQTASIAPTSTATATPSPSPSPTADTPVPASDVVVPAHTNLVDTRSALLAAGLAIGDIVEQPSARIAGTVLSSDPAPGVMAPRGTAVRLSVASGSNIVPDVSGMDAAAALTALETAGFVPVQTAAVSDRPAGAVVAVEPAAGATVRLGAGVTVSVAIPRPAPSPVTPTPTPTPTITPTPTPTVAPG